MLEASVVARRSAADWGSAGAHSLGAADVPAYTPMPVPVDLSSLIGGPSVVASMPPALQAQLSALQAMVDELDALHHAGVHIEDCCEPATCKMGHGRSLAVMV
jgi:hypothetical protein